MKPYEPVVLVVADVVRGRSADVVTDDPRAGEMSIDNSSPLHTKRIELSRIKLRSSLSSNRSTFCSYSFSDTSQKRYTGARLYRVLVTTTSPLTDVQTVSGLDVTILNAQCMHVPCRSLVGLLLTVTD